MGYIIKGRLTNRPSSDPLFWAELQAGVLDDLWLIMVTGGFFYGIHNE